MEYNNIEIWMKAHSYLIQQLQSEFTAVLDKIPSNAVGLEIGCYSGGTTIAFAMKCSKLVTIDIQKIFDTTEVEKYCNHLFLVGDSKSQLIYNEASQFLSNELADFAFIDGDHSEDGAYSDYMMYKSLVKPNGLMFFHDIVDSPYHHSHGCYVASAWNRIKENHEYKEFVQGEIWAGIGMIVI